MVPKGGWSSRAVPALGLAAAFLLAGCASSAKEAGVGKGLAGGIVEQTQEAIVGAATGGLEGVVLNENGAPVRNVHVTVVGTQFFNTTGRDGTFLFPQLAPGDYVLRADQKDYESVETKTNVAEGKLTKVAITLIANDGVSTGFRDHVHDLYGDATELTILDATVQQKATMLSGGADKPNACVSPPLPSGVVLNADFSCFSLPIYLPDNHIIPPGTKELRVTVSWEKRDLVATVDFRWTSANGSSPTGFGRLTMSPGDTKTIPTRDDMNDNGHARYTLWTFVIGQRPNAGGVSYGSDILNEQFIGAYKVKIVAVKGDVILPEPAHARFWANGDRIVLRDADTHFLNQTPNPRTRDARVTSCSSTLNQWCWVLPAKTTVPPGTTRLDVTLSYASPAVAAAATTKALAFRTASQHPGRASLATLKVDDKPGLEPGKVLYHLKLAAEDADAFYQRTSTWMFLLANQGAERSTDYNPNRAPVDCASPAGTCIFDKVTLHVEAVNENWAADKAAGRV